jgi:hypothetical protein
MSVETISFSSKENLTSEPETERRFDLDEATVKARFEDIVEAEEKYAVGDPVERERRDQATSYKPSEGYDINSMKAAG